MHNNITNLYVVGTLVCTRVYSVLAIPFSRCCAVMHSRIKVQQTTDLWGFFAVSPLLFALNHLTVIFNYLHFVVLHCSHCPLPILTLYTALSHSDLCWYSLLLKIRHKILCLIHICFPLLFVVILHRSFSKYKKHRAIEKIDQFEHFSNSWYLLLSTGRFIQQHYQMCTCIVRDRLSYECLDNFWLFEKIYNNTDKGMQS